MEEQLRKLSVAVDAWKLCRGMNGKYWVEAWFKDDDGWSRGDECDTAIGAVGAALKVAAGSTTT